MSDPGFSADERKAMRQRAEEIRSTKRLKGATKTARELEACTEAIDALTGIDLAVAVLLHRVVTEQAPELNPKTWYGFPAYAKDGKVIVFYQPTAKFGTRYGTVGFSEDATLDSGPMWATAFAVTSVDGQVKLDLTRLVRAAVGRP